MNKLGQAIIAARKKKKWSRENLIQFMKPPFFSVGYLATVERDGVIPVAARIIQIADTLGMDREILWKLAKEEKVKIYTEELEETYRRTLEIYKDRNLSTKF